MSMNTLCLITNIAPHYRRPIFEQIDKKIGCDFYIGDHIESELKTFNYHVLSGYRKTVHNIFFHHWYWQRKTVRLIFKPYKYYILDGEPYCLSSWAILLLAKLLGKQTIAWTHGWYGRERGMKKHVKKVFYALFSKLMLYNEYAIDLMVKEEFDKNKIYCIANSLDSDQELAIRKQLRPSDIYQLHFGNAYPTIIYCGRIQKRKKIEQIFESLYILRSQGDIVNLVIVGKDVDGAYLANDIRRLKLEKQIWMYGPCYDDYQLGELFYNATVCVSPGNVGLSAIHSLTFGCPVITHDHFPDQMPEFEAIQPNVTGDFFKQNDVKDLARVIKKWIEKSRDNKSAIQQAAFKEIDRKWNIHYQIKTMKEVMNAD
jgi:glycosyltransferase involved in cell wall biosynthesis